MDVYVTDDLPPAHWPAATPLVIEGEQARLYPAQDALRRIQQGARQLASFGFSQANLRGDGWDEARQWAFVQGFMRPQGRITVQFCGSPELQQRLQLRWQFSDWLRQQTHLPPAACTPLALVDAAEALIRSLAPAAHLRCERWVGDELAAAGFVGVHQVGCGSANPPVLWRLDYNPSGDSNAPVDSVLVGKGITFDSGGYSLKATQSMLAMKADMGGAATVTAALGLAIASGLSRRVQLILCCAENLVSAHAYKLGDILRYRNGVSVEVVNTDAEGRLVLADGLLLAAEACPRQIIDAATLTGAAVVALGKEYNALFALDEAAAARALALAERWHEPLWRLPLAPWHQEQCPSAYAMTANSRPVPAGGPGGASNAAGFLSRFVAANGAGWLHFDLAASYHDGGSTLWAAGATALGMVTIAELLQS
jgi:PepB aminopeptidase